MTTTTLADTIDSANFRKLYIAGEWVKPSTVRVLNVISPFTEEQVFQVAEADIADVDLAVEAAYKAFESGPWPHMSAPERATILQAFAAALRRRADDFAIAWTESTGVLAAMSNGSLEYAVSAIDRSIAQASSFPFIEKHPAQNGCNILVHEPVGVVAAIAPWNAPLASMLMKVGPALIAGCTLIMKPAPQTPIEAYIVAECADEAGFPPGVLNLITADREASDYLVRHRYVDKVSFTGSLATGRRVALVCADRIARVTLELGGKSAAIVLDDYDLEKAAKNLVDAICVLNGQNCAALTRVIVSRKRHDELVEHLASAMQMITIGNPYDPEIKLGPISMKSQLEKIEAYIAKGIAEGAILVTGGRRPAKLKCGYYFEPTLFANVDNNMSIAQEEIFGPVLCVIPCDGESDAIRIANDSPFGLGGAVYTNDTNAAYRVARRFRTGTVGHNGMKASFGIAFGGFKQSGIGREGGTVGLMPYLEPKTLMLGSQPQGLDI
ncbi:aldehyde dehydrogenase [Glaciecola sp. 33A]|uniref:aldehyde dehydrogenase n=1 Tax=Glaciecola sp. 33A TaxID=2057807 RepID=UPI000C31D699|nr:aldehyde dehydrogenase [Glaciecola sp. 33A]PKI01306.1 aldehyde dehydrogenase [Glaciecola sp. 33A]